MHTLKIAVAVAWIAFWIYWLVSALACGVALAVWARVHLGRNWGMPMSQKVEPELLGLALVAIMGAYFWYCARVEERNLTAAYPAYRIRTRMLIPFVL